MNSPNSTSWRSFGVVGLLFACSEAIGGTLFVPQQFATIQAGIDAAQAGDEVVVADGVYSGPGNTHIELKGKAITVRSLRGAANCVLDCGASGRAFEIKQIVPPQAVIDGFTIRDSSNPNLLHSGAIVIQNATSPTFRRCVVRSNVTTNLGGAVNASQGAKPTFDACVFAGNSSTGNGGAVIAASQAVVTLRRCTIAGNTGLGGGGLAAASGGKIVAFECIVADNVASNGADALAAGLNSSITFQHSLVEKGTAGFVTSSSGSIAFGPDNLTGDPAFIGVDAFDVHLLPASPARDAGTLAVADFEGDAPQGIPDLGADERALHAYVVGDPAPNEVFHLVGVAETGTNFYCFASAGLLNPPQATPYGPFGLATPLLPLSSFSLGLVHASGFVSAKVRVPADVPSGTTLHAQLLGANAGSAKWTNVVSIRVE